MNDSVFGRSVNEATNPTPSLKTYATDSAMRRSAVEADFSALTPLLEDPSATPWTADEAYLSTSLRDEDEVGAWTSDAFSEPLPRVTVDEPRSAAPTDEARRPMDDETAEVGRVEAAAVLSAAIDLLDACPASAVTDDAVDLVSDLDDSDDACSMAGDDFIESFVLAPSARSTSAAPGGVADLPLETVASGSAQFLTIERGPKPGTSEPRKPMPSTLPSFGMKPPRATMPLTITLRTLLTPDCSLGASEPVAPLAESVDLLDAEEPDSEVWKNRDRFDERDEADETVVKTDEDLLDPVERVFSPDPAPETDDCRDFPEDDDDDEVSTPCAAAERYLEA